MKRLSLIKVILLATCVAAQCFAQDQGAKPPVTKETMKERLTRYQQKRLAITIRLKPGSRYHFLTSYRNEVEHTAGKKEKMSGAVAVINEQTFIFRVRTFLGQTFDNKVNFDDVERVHVNIVPDGLKTTGEILFYCVLLLPTGACSI